MWAQRQIVESARTSATISYLLNTISTYGTERRLFGSTNPEVSQRYDTLVTPKGWAFAIWALIFVGETLGLICIWSNDGYAKYYDSILVPFTYACLLQSLWCVFFSKELILLSAIALTGIAYNLKICSDNIFEIAVTEVIEKVVQIPVIIDILITIPIRIHFVWTVAASIINWNMVITTLNTPKYEIFPALFSIWIAAGIGAYRALFLSDAIFPAVLAWAYAAMSAKIRSSPPENFSKDGPFLEVSTVQSLLYTFHYFLIIFLFTFLLALLCYVVLCLFCVNSSFS